MVLASKFKVWKAHSISQGGCGRPIIFAFSEIDVEKHPVLSGRSLLTYMIQLLITNRRGNGGGIGVLCYCNWRESWMPLLAS